MCTVAPVVRGHAAEILGMTMGDEEERKDLGTVVMNGRGQDRLAAEPTHGFLELQLVAQAREPT